MSSTERSPGSAAALDLLAADREIGRDLAVVDWAATPLGPPGGWPQSLRTAVSILLSSRFPMTPASDRPPASCGSITRCRWSSSPTR